MARIQTKDLNKGVTEKEIWNRMDHILRLISTAQMYVAYGDINQNLPTMYQGLQLLLDTITPDFEEHEFKLNEKNEKEKTGKILKGIKTERFKTYRTMLDSGLNLYNQSTNKAHDVATRITLRNLAYRKFQTLKYYLLQECETLGYNAKKTNTSDSYLEGNN